MPPKLEAELRTVGDFVEAYEAARVRDGFADIPAFLPHPDHPLYLAVLRELVRIELEYGWERGRLRRLEDYRISFPQLFRDRESLQLITFEDFRLRYQAGDNPVPAEYEQRFGVDTRAWPALSGPENSRSVENPGLRIIHRVSAEHLPATDGDPSAAWAELQRSDPRTAERASRAAARMPCPGESFLGFRVHTELGRGAFGRVFLARQGDLADRWVALKIAPDLWGESQTLAQLQHTHIVPIYSVHRAGPLQAVCMPFFGATTLAHVLHDVRGSAAFPASGKGLFHTLDARKSATRLTIETVAPENRASAVVNDRITPSDHLTHLEGLTYVEAVLWLAVRLADGLAHAHERGIVHRDLKPANVLLTDDGQPMLLDFNLSADTKQRSAVVAHVGGTLPYMAPEHLEAFRDGARPVDARSDVYALGVILFELLTGRHPFPLRRGPLDAILPEMIADRYRPPPVLRCWNKAVSPAVEAVVRHCLEPSPESRYTSARDLHEDLQRQLDHLPLRHTREPSWRERFAKWRRCHPRVTSSTAVAAAAALILLLLTGAGLALYRHQARLGAVDTFLRFREQWGLLRGTFSTPDPDERQLGEALAHCDHVFQRYRVLASPTWHEASAVRALAPPDQAWLREHVGELLLHRARVALRRAEKASDLDERNEQVEQALRWNERAESSYPSGESPRSLWQQRVRLYELAGRDDEARTLSIQVEGLPLHPTRDYPLVVADYLADGRFRQALALLMERKEHEKTDYWFWLTLGNCHRMLGQMTLAANCYQRAIQLQPRSYLAHFNRGLVYLEQKEYEQACADFDRVLELRPDLPQAAYNRALARFGAANHADALEDLAGVLNGPRPPTRAYFLRARIRTRQGDLAGARQDQQEGLRHEPTDEKDWIVRALARLPRDAQGALDDLNKALELNPRSRAALQDKANVLAEKLGRTAEAVTVLDRVVALYPNYVPARTGRGVLLARLGQQDAARADADEALARDRKPATLYRVAGIFALTSRQNAADRDEAFRLLSSALRHGYGFELLDTDPDLDPLRDQAEFRRLVEAARALRGPKTGS